MLKIFVGALLLICFVSRSNGECNVCNPNGVACISDNEFHMCFDGVARTTETFKCPNENQSCVKYATVCMNIESSTAEPACGAISQGCSGCGNLPDGHFACTSRNTFSMCMGGNETDVHTTCPENRLCDVSVGANGKVPCVAEPKELCDIDSPPTTGGPGDGSTGNDHTGDPNTPSTTTVYSPTPTNPTNPDVACAGRSTAGNYPDTSDATCQSYYYCYWKGGQLQGVLNHCPNGKYFNEQSRVCENQRPSWCI